MKKRLKAVLTVAVLCAVMAVGILLPHVGALVGTGNTVTCPWCNWDNAFVVESVKDNGDGTHTITGYCKRVAAMSCFPESSGSDGKSFTKNHDFGTNGVCTVCGYCEHSSLTRHDKHDECGSRSWEKYWQCNGCGAYFQDENGTKKIDKFEEEWVYQGKHEKTYVKANEGNCIEEGNDEYWHCEKCGLNYKNGNNEDDSPSVLNVSSGKDSTNHVGPVAGAEWSYDGTDHWHLCQCGEKVDMEAHHGGTATCTEQAICDDCGQPYGAVGHSYTKKTASSVEATDATCKKAATNYVKCDNCDYINYDMTVEVGEKDSNNHERSLDTSTWHRSDNTHWHMYPCCGAHADEEAHDFTYEPATCTKPAECECGETKGEPLGHKYTYDDGKYNVGWNWIGFNTDTGEGTVTATFSCTREDCDNGDNNQYVTKTATVQKDTTPGTCQS